MVDGYLVRLSAQLGRTADRERPHASRASDRPRVVPSSKASTASDFKAIASLNRDAGPAALACDPQGRQASLNQIAQIGLRNRQDPSALGTTSGWPAKLGLSSTPSGRFDWFMNARPRDLCKNPVAPQKRLVKYRSDHD